MALELKGLDIPLKLDAVIGQFLFVCASGTNANSVYLSTTECDANCIGITQDAPGAIGRAAQIRVSGLSKVVAGETLVVGDKVGNGGPSPPDGKAKKPAAGETFAGICLSGGSVNELVTVLLARGRIAA
jgi:hypothetical protein